MHTTENFYFEAITWKCDMQAISVTGGGDLCGGGGDRDGGGCSGWCGWMWVWGCVCVVVRSEITLHVHVTLPNKIWKWFWATCTGIWVRRGKLRMVCRMDSRLYSADGWLMSKVLVGLWGNLYLLQITPDCALVGNKLSKSDSAILATCHLWEWVHNLALPRSKVHNKTKLLMYVARE